MLETADLSNLARLSICIFVLVCLFLLFDCPGQFLFLFPRQAIYFIPSRSPISSINRYELFLFIVSIGNFKLFINNLKSF